MPPPDDASPRLTPSGAALLLAAGCAAALAVAGVLGLCVRVFRWAAWGG
jgi:hypothetical protein